MSDLAIFIVGGGVFSLLLTGLYLSAREFIRVSDRPDRLKGADIRQLRTVENDEAA